MAVNAMTVPAGRALKVLKSGWNMQVDNGQHMSWMLHGPPGVGKTQIAEAMARHIGGPLYDIRLTQIDTADLRGLPYYDHDTLTTKWYRPEDLPREPRPSVLFLDELTSAAPMLQPTVYGLLQERRVGMHRIPEDTFIMAAGNRVEDGAVAYEMGTALADRLVHLIVEADPTDWLESYAIPQGFHPSVTAFIKTRPDRLETLAASITADHLIAATPRSWERVSHIMQHVNDRDTRMVMISGLVGTAVAAEFIRMAEDIEANVDVVRLLSTPQHERPALYPASLHGLNAVIFGIAAVANADNIDAAIECILGIAELEGAGKRGGQFAALPLRELATAGFEMLIERSFALGLADRMLDNPSYKKHIAKRVSLGLG
ncbi:ATP-binding protein [Celeribacter sp. ULVN23_4]